MQHVSRRVFLSLGSVLWLPEGAGAAPALPAGEEAVSAAPPEFPGHPPAMVREVVATAHGNLARLRELVGERPALARAAVDWGFGDWETALGAASHMGRRDIAEHLIANGARPSIFSAAMLGQLDVVKAFVAASPGIQRIPGPHSISLLAHARAGGPPAGAVRQYLEALGDADGQPSAPITDAETATLTGTYVFGAGASDRIAIAVEPFGLTFTRQGAIGRPLRHLGNRVFHPAGAADVRIAFAGTPPAMTITDGALTVTARRE
jgi:hypothetical protein